MIGFHDILRSAPFPDLNAVLIAALVFQLLKLVLLILSIPKMENIYILMIPTRSNALSSIKRICPIQVLSVCCFQLLICIRSRRPCPGHFPRLVGAGVRLDEYFLAVLSRFTISHLGLLSSQVLVLTYLFTSSNVSTRFKSGSLAMSSLDSYAHIFEYGAIQDHLVKGRLLFQMSSFCKYTA